MPEKLLVDLCGGLIGAGIGLTALFVWLRSRKRRPPSDTHADPVIPVLRATEQEEARMRTDTAEQAIAEIVEDAAQPIDEQSRSNADWLNSR